MIGWLVALGSAALVAWLLAPAKPLVHAFQQRDIPAQLRGFIAHLAVGSTMQFCCGDPPRRFLFRKVRPSTDARPLRFEVPGGGLSAADRGAVARTLASKGFDVMPADETSRSVLSIPELDPSEALRVMEVSREALGLPLDTTFEVRFNGRQSFAEFKRYVLRRS